MPKHLLIVLSGPSGVGKGTIIKSLKKSFKFAESISCTTRAMRSGEKDGKEYFFISKEEFKRRIEDGGFLEYSEHFGNFYGTPCDFVKKTLESRDVVLEIEVNGAMNVKKIFPEALLVLVAPPALSKLKERLSLRNTETQEAIEIRRARAVYELENFQSYDFCIINDDLRKAVADVKSIIRAEKLRTRNMEDKMKKILEDRT